MNEQYRNEVRSATKEVQWTLGYIVWRLILVVVILSALGWALTILTRPAQVVERVTDPDRIIQNYEWFEETYNDVQALDRQITNAQSQVSAFGEGLGPRDGWTRTDREEYNRLNTVVLGLRNQRDGVIADYNARSNQITRNLWKGGTLPYQLKLVDDKTTEVWIK